MGFLGIGKLMKFVPKAVVSGFVNALALLIIQAELPQLGFDQLFGLERHQNIGLLPTTAQLPAIWVLSALGILIVYLAPRLTRRIPPQLISIAIVTLISIALKLNLPKVGDLGSLPDRLHIPILPWRLPSSDILTMPELLTMFPIAVAISLVGLLETFLTADYLDELTNTNCKKNEARRTSKYMFIDICGMAGCA